MGSTGQLEDPQVAIAVAEAETVVVEIFPESLFSVPQTINSTAAL